VLVVQRLDVVSDVAVFDFDSCCVVCCGRCQDVDGVATAVQLAVGG
jgi:hypothetical protein